MASHGRPWIFGIGAVAALLAGGAAVTWYVAAPEAVAPVAIAPPPPVPAPPPTTLALAAPGCAFDAMTPATGPQDGKFVLEAGLAIHGAADPAPFLAVAEEATRAGRQRDAEVALIAACRLAGQSGARTAPLADAQSRLADHYVALARRSTDAKERQALRQRAESLLGASVHAYAESLGRNASRTHLAEQRLAALDQALVAPVQPAAVSAQSRPATSTMGAARQSLADRPPRASEDVGQVDSDLQRLYAQARAVSRDPGGLQRRHQQALDQRAACNGDADCLRGWYAQRKRQLFDEF